MATNPCYLDKTGLTICTGQDFKDTGWNTVRGSLSRDLDEGFQDFFATADHFLKQKGESNRIKIKYGQERFKESPSLGTALDVIGIAAAQTMVDLAMSVKHIPSVISSAANSVKDNVDRATRPNGPTPEAVALAGFYTVTDLTQWLGKLFTKGGEAAGIAAAQTVNGDMGDATSNAIVACLVFAPIARTFGIANTSTFAGVPISVEPLTPALALSSGGTIAIAGFAKQTVADAVTVGAVATDAVGIFTSVLAMSSKDGPPPNGETGKKTGDKKGVSKYPLSTDELARQVVERLRLSVSPEHVVKKLRIHFGVDDISAYRYRITKITDTTINIRVAATSGGDISYHGIRLEASSYTSFIKNGKRTEVTDVSIRYSGRDIGPSSSARWHGVGRGRNPHLDDGPDSLGVDHGSALGDAL